MIQLNLLPSVKLEYVKAEHQKRLVLTTAILVSLACIAILVLTFGYDLYQKKHINDLGKNITNKVSQLQNVPNLNKMLTVQNQLNSITKLHEAKPDASRIFDDINELTPSQVNLSHLTVDFTKMTITINGTTDSLKSVNQYIDVLRLTTYTDDSQTTPNQAFNPVVLTTFSLTTGTQQPASFTITATYNQDIFNIANSKVTLSVPSITTTRLEEQQPSDLFQIPASATTSQGGGQ